MQKNFDDIKDLTQKILSEDYLPIYVKNVLVEESFSPGKECRVLLTLDQGIQAPGKGVGLVESVFEALVSHYGRSYKSILNLTLDGFELKSKSNGKVAEAEASLFLKNSYGSLIKHTYLSRSPTVSLVAVSSLAVEGMVNSERAFKSLMRALEDAKARGRQDLVSKFTISLAEIVQVNSYVGIEA